MLNRAAPPVGLPLHWDPDIVAAMGKDFDYSNPDICLEDDFMSIVAQDNFPIIVHLPRGEREVGEDELVLEQDYDVVTYVSDDDIGDSDDDYKGEDEDGNASVDCELMSEAPSRFTDYSLSSSVVPRSNGLTLLDERFERVMEGYDEELLGALDELSIDTGDGGPEDLTWTDQRLLRLAVEDFERNFAGPALRTDLQIEEGGVLKPVNHSSTSSSSEGDLEEVKEVEKLQFDCQSIIFTHCNLYNHPTKISEPKSSNPKVHRKRAEDSPSSDTTEHPLESLKADVLINGRRPKDETAEEKKARKQALKQDKRVRREVKKASQAAPNYKTGHGVIWCDF